jgi:hypothetical protein
MAVQKRITCSPRCVCRTNGLRPLVRPPPQKLAEYVPAIYIERGILAWEDEGRIEPVDVGRIR